MTHWIAGKNGLAEYLNESIWTVERMLQDGLPAYRRDRKYKFIADEVDTWIRDNFRVSGNGMVRQDARVIEITTKLMRGIRS
jgi:excisionase family DNA binding protein